MPGEITKDATLTVGLEGVEQVAAAASKALDPWKKAQEKASKEWGKFGEDVGRSLGGIISDVARTATVMGTLDVGKQAASFRTFQETLARFGAVSGQSIGTLQEQFTALAAAQPEFKVEQYQATAAALQRMTGDGRGAVEIMQQLAKQAIDTNQSLDEMAGTAGSLRNAFNIGLKETPALMSAINTAGERSGQAGGGAALQRQIKGLAPTISKLNIKDQRGFVNMMSQLGNGLSETQQTEVQQRALTTMTRDPEILRMRLGMKPSEFFDKQGRINFDQKFASRWLGLVKKDVGNNETARVLRQEQNLGPMATAAVMSLDQQKIDRQAAQGDLGAKGIDPVVKDAMAVQRKNELAQMTDVGGFMASAQNKWNKAFEGHPMLQAAAGVLGAGGIGAAATKALPWLGGKIFGAAGAATAGTGSTAAGLAGPALLVAAAGAGGFMAGGKLDEATGLSDKWAELVAGMTGVKTPKMAQREAIEDDQQRRGTSGPDPAFFAQLTQSITDAVRDIRIEVPIVNQSDSPIAATEGGRASSRGGQ